MATAKKGKKSSKAKSGSKGKKSNNNMSSFSKFMLILLFLAVLAGAVLYTIKNFNINIDKNKELRQEVTSKNNNVKENIVKVESKVKEDVKKEDKVEKQTSETKTMTNSTKTIDVKGKTAELKQEVKVSKTMTGSWHSSEQGAFLTMDEYGYRIDFSNVHASKPITGNYRIENNLIIFSSDGTECKNEEGTYRINFFKKNISLTCKSDNCTDRRNILEADWEWLEY